MEENCFTILCWLLPYNNVNQPWVYLSPLHLDPPPRLLQVVTEYCIEQPVLYSSFPLAVFFTFTLDLLRFMLRFRIKSSWWMFYVLLRRIWLLLLLCSALQTPTRSSWLVLFGFPESLLIFDLLFPWFLRWSVMSGAHPSVSFQFCVCFTYSGTPYQAQTHFGSLSLQRNDPFIIMYYLSMSLEIVLVLKATFADMNRAIATLFLLESGWCLFFSVFWDV